MLKATGTIPIPRCYTKGYNKKGEHMKRWMWLMLSFSLLSGWGEKEIHVQTTLPEGVAGVEWL